MDVPGRSRGANPCLGVPGDLSSLRSERFRRDATTGILLFVLLLSLWPSPAIAQTARFHLQVGDTSTITLLRWSPDDRFLLTASQHEGGLRLWDVAAGRVIWKRDTSFLQEDLEEYDIEHAAWTRDGKLVATGTENGKLQLWDATIGALVWNVEAHGGEIEALAISPDSAVLVSSAETEEYTWELRAWKLADGSPIRDLGARQADAIHFVDATRFRTGSARGEVTLWSAADWRELETRRLSPCGRAGKFLGVAAFSPDLSSAAVRCDRTLLVVAVDSGRVLGRAADPARDKKLLFASDGGGPYIADGLGDHLYDLRGRKVIAMRGMARGALDSRGSRLAAFSHGYDGVEILNLQTGKREDWLVGHPGEITALAFSPDGARFASGSGDLVVRVWDAAGPKVLLELPGNTDTITSVVFSRDGRQLTSESEKERIVWNAVTGAKVRTLPGTGPVMTGSERALSPSGRLALVEEHDKPFRLVDAKTNATIKEFVEIDQLDALVFGPDEQHFLVKSWWRGWQLWSVETGRPLREFEVGYSHSNSVAFHPDGRTFVTGGSGQNLFMFDLESGRTLWSLFPVDHEQFEGRRAAEARRIAFLRRKDERARLADAENEAYRARVVLAFAHFGEMTDPGERRMLEPDEPKQSKIRKPSSEANAVWLRLHNGSPFPISVPTHSMYFPTGECAFTFPSGTKLPGLCDAREIYVWMGLEDRTGKSIPYGFDFGSSVTLLPGTSVLFPVPRAILANGKAIRFEYSFLNETPEGKVEPYGNPVVLRFREADIPSQR